jgi:hypothetical protein
MGPARVARWARSQHPDHLWTKWMLRVMYDFWATIAKQARFALAVDAVWAR